MPAARPPRSSSTARQPPRTSISRVKRAKLTFNAPALFNLAGELIVVDGKAYLKTTLQGDKYNVIDLGSDLPVDPANPGSLVDNLGDFLLKPGVDPVKGDDVACGSKQCYTVKADLTADELAALGVGATAGLPVTSPARAWP